MVNSVALSESGKYERGDASPSIEVEKRIADALEVSLDYLLGKTSLELDKTTLKGLKKSLNFLLKREARVIDALIRGFKSKQAYSLKIPRFKPRSLKISFRKQIGGFILSFKIPASLIHLTISTTVFLLKSRQA